MNYFSNSTKYLKNIFFFFSCSGNYFMMLQKIKKNQLPIHVVNMTQSQLFKILILKIIRIVRSISASRSTEKCCLKRYIFQ